MVNERIILKKDRVYNILKNRIMQHELAVHEKLPREQVLAEELNVGIVTLRAALSRLSDEGLIERIHGRGTFVASPATVQRTIMVVNSTESGIESSWHYITPKVNSVAEKYNLKTFETTDQTLAIISDDDLKTFVKQNNIIGVILTINAFNGDEPIIEKLRTMQLPIILAHSRLSDVTITGFAGVAIDEKRGWQAAISHLAGQGYKSVAVIGSPYNNGFRRNSKHETLQYLMECGLDVNPQLVTTAYFDKSLIANAVVDLLNVQPKPTAILCYSDSYAMYVYDKVKELNLRIPGDIAVMGICGFPDAALLSPPLSTIDYNYGKIAEIAVDMVIKPDPWFDSITKKGILRMTDFELKSRKSTSSAKEVQAGRAMMTGQSGGDSLVTYQPNLNQEVAYG